MIGGVERRAITVRGAVQGVGMRPYVYGLAQRLGLTGFVRNRSGAVDIEVEGAPAAVGRFLDELASHPPPLARIDVLRSASAPPMGDGAFRIEASEPDAGFAATVPADLATCDDCLRELFDPAERRHRYAFLNCTNCGPRLTIVDAVPYDRERTAMAAFPMCADCRAEYEDPTDRRFHAQPIACPACGPRLELVDSEGRPRAAVDPVAMAIADLHAGRIVAIKGLGGYHLACDATNEAAVSALRRRKHRDEKPFAIMLPSIAATRALCEVHADERAALESPQRPIVLLRRRTAPDPAAPRVACSVAPDSPAMLGVMLPYTPLHHLLLREGSFLGLVMTSGNRAEEPMAYRDESAVQDLLGIADAFLTHDRPIRTRCDDSVVRRLDASGAGGITPLRRSRGYTPLPFALREPLGRPTLAVGGDAKAAFALGHEDRAVLSHHLGDLEHHAAYEAFVAAIDHYERLYGVTPARIAHDLHPDYASTRYAHERAGRDPIELVAVQHHHAHMAACMLENGLAGPAIGVCFDGAGFGPDGTIWGGEFLVGGFRRVERVARLRQVPLPGGDRAARQPWRSALSHLVCAGLDPMESDLARRVGRDRARAVLELVTRRTHAPLTSSVGRLFDAVAALTGVCDQASFEGQAAMQLEGLASGLPPDDAYSFGKDDAASLDPGPVVRAIRDDVLRGVPASVISRRFHSALAAAVTGACVTIRASTGVGAVVLSGGVFSNAVLTTEVVGRLAAAGLRAHRHRSVPPNDGGLSLGQIAVAAALDHTG
ncbi:MAG TPA: carbamoyltransferase HypF [Polyangiaceae bacterium]|nr:carbamoyltransferase HypF [Polyangiaceae bacterium]